MFAIAIDAVGGAAAEQELPYAIALAAIDDHIAAQAVLDGQRQLGVGLLDMDLDVVPVLRDHPHLDHRITDDQLRRTRRVGPGHRAGQHHSGPDPSAHKRLLHTIWRQT